MNKFFRNLIIVLAIFLIVAGIFMLFGNNKTNVATVPLGKVADEVTAGQVSKIEVSDNQIDLTVTLKDNTKQISTKEKEVALSDELKNTYGVDAAKIKDANIVSTSGSSSSFWVSTILPFVIPFLLIAGFIWFLMRQVQGNNNRAMSFGQSGA